MNPTSAIATSESALAMGSFSRQEGFSPPLEMIYEIFSWLTPRDRHPYYQDSSLKKAIAFVDRLDWKPYQEFINELSEKVERIAATELKAEFSSLLTNLIELNAEDASFYEREADFFVALFNLTPPAFDHLRTSFQEEHPFIQETITYQLLKDNRRLSPNGLGQQLKDLAKREHMFPLHKIFPLLPFDNQATSIRNVISTYATAAIIEPYCKSSVIACYREELLFFTKKLAEIPDTLGLVHVHTRGIYFKFTLVFLIHYGYLEDGRELFGILPSNPSIMKDSPNPQMRGPLDEVAYFAPFRFLLSHSSLENTKAFLRMFPGNKEVASAFQAGFLYAATRFLEEERGVALFEHFTHEDLNWAPPNYRRFLTPILKKFIKKLSGSLEEELESELKRELSSLLTNLTELNGKDDKIGALFLTLFHLTPPAFDYLCTHLGEDRHFIFLEEVSIYRNFAPPIPLLPPPLTLEETLLKWAKGESFFLPDQIFLLLPPDYQAYYLANRFLNIFLPPAN